MLKITTDSSVLKNSYVYVTFPVDKISQKLPTVFQSLVIQFHWNFCFRNRTSFECLDILLLLLLLGIFQDNLFIIGWMWPLITVWYIYSQCLWNRPWNNQKDIIHQMSFYFALMSSSPMKKKKTHTTGYRYTLYFLLITVEVLVHLSKPRCARLFKSPPRFLYLAH